MLTRSRPSDDLLTLAALVFELTCSAVHHPPSSAGAQAHKLTDIDYFRPLWLMTIGRAPVVGHLVAYGPFLSYRSRRCSNCCPTKI